MKMKRLLSVVGISLSLLVLVGMIVILVRGAGQAIPSSQAFQSPLRFQSPVGTPAQLPGTPIVSRPPKPTFTPTPIPTSTPVPTALPLPPSDFPALWVENFPEGQGSVLWLADPRDIGGRREVLRFDQDAIAEVSLSPNGRKMAMITRYWKTATLWIANANGNGLQQLDQNSTLGGLLWSQDSRLLAYEAGWLEESIMPSYKTGAPTSWLVGQGAVELVDITTGEKRRLLEAQDDLPLSMLGWSADGQELYYVLAQEEDDMYQLWATSQEGQDARRIVSGSNAVLGVPLLSPDGSKFLVGTSEGVSWFSANGHDQQVITQPQQGFTAIWAPNSQDLIVSYWNSDYSEMVVQSINLYTRSTRNLGSIRPIGDWQLLAISRDYQWLAAYHYYGGLYWIHLPTGTTIPIPSQDHQLVFVAWVSNTALTIGEETQ